MATRTDRLLSRNVAFVVLVVLALLASACSQRDPAIRASDTSSPVEQTTTTEHDESEVELTNEMPADLMDDSTTAEAPADQETLFPDVIDATATLDGDGTWTVAATLSSPYDSPERYADAWRVVGPDGTEFGIRELGHDHASEQPFTRSQGGIAIPDDVSIVTIEGRDQVSGWGGQTFDLELPRE